MKTSQNVTFKFLIPNKSKIYDITLEVREVMSERVGYLS